MANTRFSIKSTLTKKELFEVKPITDLGFNCIILFHDYCSWDKEDAAFKRGNSPFMLNSVEVLMRVYNFDLVTAKQRLWRETEAMEQRYCDARDDYIRKQSPRQAVVQWFGFIELCIAGNAIWSTTTARYDKSKPAPLRLEPRAQAEITDQKQGASRRQCQADSESERSLSNHKEVDPLVELEQEIDHTSPIVDQDNHNMPIHPELSLQEGFDSKESAAINENQIILEPLTYITAFSGGQARGTLLDGLDLWFSVPAQPLDIIHDVIEKTHNISLLLDDIYDQSPTRRSRPAAHKVYGSAKTINSATCALTNCFGDISNLSKAASRAWIETGGLFYMAARLMQAEATQNMRLDLERLMALLGQYYQIRDDYQDIISIETDASKHSDLDQVTFTLPMIHAISKQQELGSTELLSMLQSSRLAGYMEREMKVQFLTRLKELGSLEYTKTFLDKLYSEVLDELDMLEGKVGVKNWILRLLLFRLKL